MSPSIVLKMIRREPTLCMISLYSATSGSHTVNQLNFTAAKFRGLPIFLYFAHFNFAFCYLRMFPEKKCCFTKMPVAPLFMV